MRTFRLVLAYDGTDFHGWQVQPKRRTVQGELEAALAGVVDAPPERVPGAGRTDAGVHARGQVASFTCDTRLPARAIAPLLNRRLPRDVRVVAAAEAGEGFHARHSARARAYAYRVLERDDVLTGRYAWCMRRRIDWVRVDAATRALERTADFSAFAAAGSPAGTNVCEVRRARWTPRAGGARLDIEADHFLYHMVRNVVGTALRLGGVRDPAGAMLDVLRSGDRARAGATAPAHGLCLERVRYDDGGGTSTA